MEDIQLKLNEAGRGAFVIEQDGNQIAEMEIGVQNGNLTVYHTEVSDALKGKGVASQLISTMATYARAKKLKVIPLCSYVLAQFKRHPETYSDLWNKEWHGK